MKVHDHKEYSSGAAEPRESFSYSAAPEDLEECRSESSASSLNSTSWATDIAQTLQLGNQFMGVASDVVGLARIEALLAVRTLSKLIMLWLLIMPVMLLTWCAFSALLAWWVYAASEQIGLGMLTFFLQQVFLLLVCYWLFLRYRARMTLPYTRAQIDTLVRSIQYGFNGRSETKE